MRVVLDTGAFFRPRELHSIPEEIDIVVPALAVAERRRQLIRDGRSAREFLDLISPFTVEPFAEVEALRTPYLDDAGWKIHARDAMIAAHVREGDVLWTTNPRDFLALGLSPHQVRAV